jgi:Zn-dependent M16 (insulinase) family peptidase
MHGGDPIAGLEINKKIARLREELSDDEFWKRRVEQYFLNNDNKIVFVMQPSESFNEELAANERNRLEEQVSKLTTADREVILAQGLELARLQDTHQGIYVHSHQS